MVFKTSSKQNQERESYGLVSPRSGEMNVLIGPKLILSRR